MTMPLTTAAELLALKARLKSTWESGDYGVIAGYLEKGALEFLDRIEAAPGSDLLDVACGPGQLAISAARKGLRVTGLDVATNLIEQARVGAAHERLEIRFDEGDAESLPYPDASFETVVSLFGAMFAPRPELAAAEMMRVCRPGGRIVMANWTPEGHVGQMFRVIGKHVPPPPVPSPLLWGDEWTCRRRLAGLENPTVTRHLYPFECAFGPERVVDIFIRNYGPTREGHLSLNAVGQQMLHADLTALWTRNNKGSTGATRVMAEYLEIAGVMP